MLKASMSLPNAFSAVIAADDAEALARLIVSDTVFEAADAVGHSALHLAAMENSLGCLDVLLKHPACDVNVYNKQGRTALQLSAFRGHHLVVERLLSVDGIQVNQRSQGNGCTATYFASCAGHTNVVEMLLRAGADANATTQSNSTPLIVAAFAGNLKSVKLLLSAGANPNVKNDAGATAMHIAASNGSCDIVEYLLSHQGDETICDAQGHTPCDVLKFYTLHGVPPAESRLRSKNDNNKNNNNNNNNNNNRAGPRDQPDYVYSSTSAECDCSERRERLDALCSRVESCFVVTQKVAQHRDTNGSTECYAFANASTTTKWSHRDGGAVTSSAYEEERNTLKTPTATSPREQEGRSGRTTSFRASEKHDVSSPLDPGRDSSTHSGSRSAGELSEKSHQTVVTELFI